MSIKLERIVNDKNSSLRVLHIDALASEFTWNYHYHPEIEIVFVFSGFGRRHVGNHISYYENGDLVLIGSNLPHSGFGFGALKRHEEIVIQFKLDILGDNILNNKEFETIAKLMQMAKDGLAFGKKTQERASKYVISMNKKVGMERFLELISFLDFLSKSDEIEVLNPEISIEKFNLKDSERTAKIFEFTENNYHKETNSQHIAEIINMTLPAFCNYFKKNYHCTYTDFLNEFRINKACKLLFEGKNITEACFETGFNSLAYFNRTFNKFKKLNPSAFQNLYYNK